MKIWNLEKEYHETNKVCGNFIVKSPMWRVTSNGTFIYGPYESSPHAAIWRWFVEQIFDWMPRPLRQKILLAKHKRFLARRKK